jgi:predicted transcriptional regulator
MGCDFGIVNFRRFDYKPFVMQEDNIYEMSAEEIDTVEDGIRQIELGQSIPHEEVKRQMNEWLKSFDVNTKRPASD